MKIPSLLTLLLLSLWHNGSQGFVVLGPTTKSMISKTQQQSSSSSTCLRMGLLDNLMSPSKNGENEEEEVARKKMTATLMKEGNLEKFQQRVERINALESTIEEYSDEELQAKTNEFKIRLNEKGEDINGPLLEEAFAVVREAAWRVLELRHYDVQLLGGLVLHEGNIAEMATGEGKTLVATLPAYVNALLDGKSSYIITVNDYLARRDMEKMRQIFSFLGLSVGLIQSYMEDEEERRRAYRSDVVYVTHSELGFDYLRDHLALSPEQTVLPQTLLQKEDGEKWDSFCLVDEADSVMIDEARTPLIISKQVPAPAQRYATAQRLAEALKKDVHYTVDVKNKNIIMTERGYRDSEMALKVSSLFELQSVDNQAWAPFISNAIKAKELFTKDSDYAIVKGDNSTRSIEIIDAFTGRVLKGRRWSDGLHQSIEAKEGILPVSQQSQVIAKVTYQSLFRQFQRLSGMTGTAATDAQEFKAVYNLNVKVIPTALPMARRDYPDVVFKTRKAATDAMLREIKNVGGGQDGGRPCLIGTTTVEQSQQLVETLKREANIDAQLLNASPKNAPREAEIIAQAGRCGVVTVATNMAGRGTDILLGGCPKTMARLQVRSRLSHLVNEESDQLPPNPDKSYYPIELSETQTTLLNDAVRVMEQKYNDKSLSALELQELITIASDATEAEDEQDYVIALRMALDSIKTLYQETLNKERDIVLAAGGLYVMGTTRHESMRIDNQLRGRAGRQGDPGSSRYFLSFQDDLFQVFGDGSKLTDMLERFRVADDMPVESPQVSETIDKIQNQVEEKFRDMRVEILRFDETLNQQRRALYSERCNLLLATPETSLNLFREWNTELITSIVRANTDNKGKVDMNKVVDRLQQFFPSVSFDTLQEQQENVETIATQLVQTTLENKIKEIPSLGRSINYIMLVTMDNAWSNHLQAMENLKEVVPLRTYQNLDPVQEYRNEAFTLYQNLKTTMRNNAVYSLWQSISTTATTK